MAAMGSSTSQQTLRPAYIKSKPREGRQSLSRSIYLLQHPRPSSLLGHQKGDIRSDVRDSWKAPPRRRFGIGPHPGLPPFASRHGTKLRVGSNRVSLLKVNQEAMPMIVGIFRAFDVLGGPRLFELIWRLLVNVSSLTKSETKFASLVLGAGAIRYNSVRVAEGRLLTLIFKLNQGRAFTTFHTINLPRSGWHSREHIDLLVHELIHVYQFECVGSVYIYQALRAQRTNGYGYGGWSQLIKDRDQGMHFKDYNREQQGQIAQDYCREVLEQDRPDTDPIRLAYEPFVEDLKAGYL